MLNFEPWVYRVIGLALFDVVFAVIWICSSRQSQAE